MCVIKKDKDNHNIICVISLFCLKCNQIVNPRTFCWPYSIQYFASGLQIKEIISLTQPGHAYFPDVTGHALPTCHNAFTTFLSCPYFIYVIKIYVRKF